MGQSVLSYRDSYALASDRISLSNISTPMRAWVSVVKSDPRDQTDTLPDFLQPSRANLGAYAPSFYFVNSPSKPFSNRTWEEQMAYRIHYAPAANDNSRLRVITSNNRDARTEVSISDLKRFGHAPYWEDKGETWRGDLYRGNFKEWDLATKRSHTITTGTGFREIGLWKSPEFRHNYSPHDVSMTNINVPITGLYGEVPINQVGFYISKLGNLEHDLRDVLFRGKFGYNPETEAWIDFIQSRGLGPGREIRYLGVENIKGAIARTYHPADPADGWAALVASKDMYDNALGMALGQGLRGEEAIKFAKRAVWYHELYHVFNREKVTSEREDEIRVAELLEEFFDSRASMLEGKIAQYYKAMARENRSYRAGWETGRIKGHSLASRLETLSKQYYSEARAQGMDETEAREYAASQLEREIEKETGNSKGKAGNGNKNQESKYEEGDTTDNQSGEYKSENTNSHSENNPEAANDNQPEAANDNSTSQSQQSEAA